uniref:PDZ domain-containing protein n=1 Tax=Macrostomum lignano TaxID=282301 RepID=A0A1I8HDG7_9PLAT
MDRSLEVAPGTAGHCRRCKGRLAAACAIQDRHELQGPSSSTAQRTDRLLENVSTNSNALLNDYGEDESDTNSYTSIAAIVQLQRGTGSLGISFIGGCDTSLGCVLIQKIMPGGLADRDDRLRSGDVILQVNDNDLTRATHGEARQALSSGAAASQCDIAILRHVCAASNVSNNGSYSIELLAAQRNRALASAANGRRRRPLLLRIRIAPSQGSSRLGIRLVCRSLTPGSPAHRDGRLRQGDRVLELNGLDTGACPDRWEADTIGQLTGAPISLLILRTESFTVEPVEAATAGGKSQPDPVTTLQENSFV